MKGQFTYRGFGIDAINGNQHYNGDIQSGRLPITGSSIGGYRRSKPHFRKTISDFFKDKNSNSKGSSGSIQDINSGTNTDSRQSKESGFIVSPRTAKYLKDHPPQHKNEGFEPIHVSAEFLKNNPDFKGEEGYVVSPRTLEYLRSLPPGNYQTYGGSGDPGGPGGFEGPEGPGGFGGSGHIVSPRTFEYLKNNPPGQYGSRRIKRNVGTRLHGNHHVSKSKTPL